MTAPAIPTPRPARFRGYDHPVLMWLARHRVATVHQVVARFWTLDGKAPDHGFRVVRALETRGLVHTWPLRADLGRASRRLVALTPGGFAEIGWPGYRGDVPASEGALHRRLQAVELHLSLEARGFIHTVGDVEPWRVLQVAALDHARRVRGLAIDPQRLGVIRRAPPQPLPLGVWSGPEDEARLVLHPASGAALRRTIARLPATLSLFQPLAFTVTHADPVLLARARQALERWAERARCTVSIEELPSFLARPHPRSDGTLGVSVYREHGIANPRALLTRRV